jgi:hypothetical protein
MLRDCSQYLAKLQFRFLERSPISNRQVPQWKFLSPFVECGMQTEKSAHVALEENGAE